MRFLAGLLVLVCALSINAATIDRTDAWIAHLDRFAAAHPELTEAQKALVTEARAMLADGVGAKVRANDADARAAFAVFKTRAANAFSRELYLAAFVRLEQPASMAGWRGSAKSMIPDCDCNPNVPGCGECVPGSCRVVQGCGEFEWELCTGMCW